MKLAKQKYFDRKADARRKFSMGGLIIKAKLDHLHEDNKKALYGLLIDAQKQLQEDPKLIQKWEELGKELKK